MLQTGSSMQQVHLLMCWAQTLSWLHARDRAHGDLKYANIRVCTGEEPGLLGDMMLVDWGCSTAYKGGHPAHLQSFMV